MIATERADESLRDIMFKSPPPGWTDMFLDLHSAFEFILERHLKDVEYYPDDVDVFKAYDLCPLSRVRVVILGQDPYHNLVDGRPQAMGLAFATRRGCRVQPSLKNIYKELQREYDDFKTPNHGDLTSWATQGVLLLNTALTVKPHIANSFKGRWNNVIKWTLNAIDAANPTCIYLLWGGEAQEWKRAIGDNAEILTSSHPSPLSFKRGREPFDGNGHFRRVNEILVERGEDPINWQV